MRVCKTFVSACVLVGVSALADTTPRRDDIIIENQQCAPLVSRFNALRLWSARLGEVPSEKIPDCLCEKAGCKMNVTKALPSTALDLLRRKTKAWGPNCFQAVLNATRVVPGPTRFASDEELLFWLNSPLCRRLGAQDNPGPGDIGLWGCDQLGKFRPEHAFVFLSNDFIFEKRSREPEDAYILGDMRSSLDKVKGYSPCAQSGAGGRFELHYYQCQALDAFLGGHAAPTEAYKRTLKEVVLAENKYNCLPWSTPGTEWVRSGVLNQIDSLADIVSALRTYSVDHSRNRKNTDSDQLLWEGLAARLSALYYVLTVNLK